MDVDCVNLYSMLSLEETGSEEAWHLIKDRFLLLSVVYLRGSLTARFMKIPELSS